MRKLEIADADVMRIAIQQEIQRSEESRYDHRLHGLLLVTGGQSCGQVAELFGEDRRTVQRWVKTLEQRGLDGLREGQRPGRPRSLQRDLRKGPDAFGLTGHLWDGKLPSEHLRRHYDVRLGVRQCQRLFSQMGFRFRKPRPQVAQSDPKKVEAFKKLRRLAQRDDVELWSLDECHFQQHGTRCRMWIPPEDRDPVVNHAPTRKSIACLGAVSLRSGKFIHVMSPKFNAATFEAYLRKLLPRQAAQAAVGEASKPSRTLVSAAVQSPVGARRAGLETRAKAGNAQSVLRQPGRTANGGRVLLRRMAETQSRAAKTMRHYLGRYV